MWTQEGETCANCPSFYWRVQSTSQQGVYEFQVFTNSRYSDGKLAPTYITDPVVLSYRSEIKRFTYVLIPAGANAHPNVLFTFNSEDISPNSIKIEYSNISVY